MHRVVRAAGGLRSRLSIPAAILMVALVAQGVLALWLGSRGWFSGDVIHYFVARGGVPGATESLNEPHISHWQVLLISFYLVLFQFFGLTAYTPYLAFSVMVHLLLVGLMYVLLQRLGVRRWVALIVCLCLLTYGAGSEAFLVDAPVALTSALALGVVAMLVLEHRGHDAKGNWIASGLLLAGVMTSLGGVIGAIWVGLASMGRATLSLFRVALLPAVIFSGWYLWQGRKASRVTVEREDWGQVPQAAWELVSRPYSDLLLGAGGGGLLLVVVLVLALLRARTHPGLAAVAMGGFVAASVHALLAVASQIGYGPESALTSRYRYVVLVLLLPALAAALDWLVDRLSPGLTPALNRLLVVPVLILIASVVATGVRAQFTTADQIETIGDDIWSLTAGTLAAASTGQAQINNSVRGALWSGDDLAALTNPDIASELPTFEASHQDRIKAESMFFTAVGSDDDGPLPKPARLRSDSYNQPLSLQKGCLTYTATNDTPTFTMTSYLGAGLVLRSEAEEITTTLRRDRDDVAADPVVWRVDPGEAVRVETTAQLAEVDVRLDVGGRVTICLE